MQFEYDPEKLIEEVKKRPGIWDFENVEYRVKNVRQTLWTEVVNELMGPSIKVSKSEFRELELQLQKKWKSIRDCFHKYIANPNRTKRPYIYSRQLAFLLKPEQVAAENEEASSESDIEKKLVKKKAWKAKKKLQLSKDDDSSEEDGGDTQENSRSNSDGDDDEPLKKIPRTSNPGVVDSFVFANVDSHQSRTDSDDPEKMFLLSLLPHLKSVPEEDRLNVKMQLLQVLQNANYNSYNSGRDVKLL